MNFSSMSSLVSHKTSRPAFFIPAELSKTKCNGVIVKASSDVDLNCRGGGGGGNDGSTNFSIFAGFGTRLDGSSCPVKSTMLDRPLKAEGSHALKLGDGTGDSGRSFLSRIGHAERDLETRSCPKTEVLSYGLKSCCESGKSKAATSEVAVPSISSTELVNLFADPEALVIVDCRNFMVYNANHIKGALNVNLANKITRKRFVDGHLSISDLVSGPEAKTEYRSKEQTAAIVIYDDNTSNISSLPAAHPLKLLASRLKSEGRDARYLEGGIQSFQTSFRQHCEHPDAQPNPPFLYSPTSQDVDAAVDTAVASEILPFLYVGSERDASSAETIKELGITHILNVTAHIPFYFEERLVCKRLPASDSGNQNLKQYFEEAIRFIESARVSNGRVLVHCQAGVSRSPTIAMAYIMARFEKSLQDTFTFMHSRRSIISPNLNFMGQLLEFGQRTDLPSFFDASLSEKYPQMMSN